MDQVNVKDEFYKFKVKDYTNILVGRYNKELEIFYISRGDGKILESYCKYRVEMNQKIK